MEERVSQQRLRMLTRASRSIIDLCSSPVVGRMDKRTVVVDAWTSVFKQSIVAAAGTSAP